MWHWRPADSGPHCDESGAPNGYTDAFAPDFGQCSLGDIHTDDGGDDEGSGGEINGEIDRLKTGHLSHNNRECSYFENILHLVETLGRRQPLGKPPAKSSSKTRNS